MWVDKCILCAALHKLTSVLFKECLHMAIWSITLSNFLLPISTLGLINVCIHTLKVNSLLLWYCLFCLEPSLSLTNLTTLMENVSERDSQMWLYMAIWLNIPSSKYNAIKSQHSSPAQRSRACWDLYITDHPSPSWKRLAYALYMRKRLEELEVVQKKYLKGE